MEFVTLHNEVKMPLEGFGVFQVTEAVVCERAVSIHQPMNDYYGSWRATEELYEEGRVKAIGVCNFYPDRLTDLCLNARIAPMVDRVELYPFFAQGTALEAI